MLLFLSLFLHEQIIGNIVWKMKSKEKRRKLKLKTTKLSYTKARCEEHTQQYIVPKCAQQFQVELRVVRNCIIIEYFSIFLSLQRHNQNYIYSSFIECVVVVCSALAHFICQSEMVLFHNCCMHFLWFVYSIWKSNVILLVIQSNWISIRVSVWCLLFHLTCDETVIQVYWANKLEQWNTRWILVIVVIVEFYCFRLHECVSFFRILRLFHLLRVLRNSMNEAENIRLSPKNLLIGVHFIRFSLLLLLYVYLSIAVRMWFEWKQRTEQFSVL